MNVDDLRKTIDPTFAVSVFLLVLLIVTSILNSMIIGVPIEKLLINPVSLPILMVFIFCLALGVGNQINKLKQRKQRYT